jgi:hypothetical protein
MLAMPTGIAAPGFELRANGELPLALPYYPAGRAIVVGLEPGIR